MRGMMRCVAGGGGIDFPDEAERQRRAALKDEATARAVAAQKAREAAECTCEPKTVKVDREEWERLQQEAAGRTTKVKATKRPAPPPPPDPWGIKAAEAERPKPVNGGPNGWRLPPARPVLRDLGRRLYPARTTPPPCPDSWGIERSRAAARR